MKREEAELLKEISCGCIADCLLSRETQCPKDLSKNSCRLDYYRYLNFLEGGNLTEAERILAKLKSRKKLTLAEKAA